MANRYRRKREKKAIDKQNARSLVPLRPQDSTPAMHAVLVP